MVTLKGWITAGTVSLILASSAMAAQVTLSVTEPSGIGRQNWPVTSGIPFAEGVLKQAGQVALTDSVGKPVPLQARVLATWPDGSVKGLLLDFQATLGPKQTQAFRLKYGEGAGAEGNPLARDLSDRIEVNAGPLQAVIRRAASWKKAEPAALSASVRSRFKIAAGAGQAYAEPYRLIENLSLNGREVLSDELLPSFVVEDARGNFYVSQLSAPVSAEVEYNGSQRACIKITGVMTTVPPTGGNAPRFKWTARLNFYRGQPTVGISFAIQRAGNMLWRYEGFNQRELDDVLPITSMAMEFKLRPNLISGAPGLAANKDLFKALATQGEAGGLQVALQTCSPQPSALEMTQEGGLRIFLWRHATGASLAIGQGFRLGADAFLQFHNANAKIDMGTFSKPLMAFAPPQWYAESRAFGELLGDDLRQFADFAHIEKAVLGKEYYAVSPLKPVQLPSVYKHGSLVAYGAYLRFLATGDRDYFDLADRRTRGERELPYYTYLPIYDDASEVAGFSVFSNYQYVKPEDIPTKWPSPVKLRQGSGCFFTCRQMSYVPRTEEYLYHYLLTGERASLELARERADDLRYGQCMLEPSLRGDDGHGHWQRVYGKAALLVQKYYEFTGDQRVLGDLNWMRGEYLMKPHPSYQFPVALATDVPSAGPYGLTFIPELGRSLYETFGDWEAVDVYIVRNADYMLNWHWDRRRGVFQTGGVQSCLLLNDPGAGGLPLCQCLGMAYEYTGDSTYMEIADRGYTTLTKKIADNRGFLDTLNAPDGPTAAVPTLTRFHYYLDQYRTHRDAKCPPEYAALSREQIGTQLAAEVISDRRIRLCQALAAKAGPGDDAVLARIAAGDPHEQVARNAATALGNVHTAEAGQLLLGLSKDAKSMPARLASMHSLAHNKKTTGLAEHLAGLLSDPQPLVRITAARLLAKVDKRKAVTALTEALPKEESPHVKKEMLQSLGATGDRSVAGTLLAALADGRAHPMVRGGAALGLGELGSDEPNILEALLILSPEVERDFGLRALVYLGTDKAAEALANSPLLGDRFGLYRSPTSLGALTTFPGPKVSLRLTELAKRNYNAGNDVVHPYLIYALARRPDSAATEGLRDIAKNHQNEQMRSLAAERLDGKPSTQPGP